MVVEIDVETRPPLQTLAWEFRIQPEADRHRSNGACFQPWCKKSLKFRVGSAGTLNEAAFVIKSFGLHRLQFSPTRATFSYSCFPSLWFVTTFHDHGLARTVHSQFDSGLLQSAPTR